MIDLITYLPDFLQNVAEFKAIQSAVSIQVNQLQNYYKNSNKQKYIQTASSDGLKLWENELGLTVNETLTDELRRENIFAKMRGQDTLTINQIKIIANTYSGSEVEVTEYFSLYKIVIKFIGSKGIPQNMAGLTDIINQLKPAHIAVEYSYTYNTWNMLDQVLWSSVSAKTWTDIRIIEEV